MALRDRQEAVITLVGGQHEGLDPVAIPESQYAKGVNIMCREGLPSQRPPYIYDYTAGDEVYDIGVYALDSVVYHVYIVQNSDNEDVADVHIRNTSTGNVTVLDSVLVAGAEKYYFCQADKYFIIQDGESEPVILNETAEYDISGLDEKQRLPIGYTMAYGHGRIFIVVDHIWNKAGTKITDLGRRFFRAGDAIQAANTASIFSFTEDLYWNEGGAMSLPNEQGFINAMAFFRNASTGQGVGALIVASRDGMSAFGVSASRDTWKDIDLAQTLFCDPNLGAYSQAAFIQVNDDIAYRSVDGIRFVRYTTTQSSGGEGTLSNVPQSFEVSKTLALDNYADIGACSMSLAKNRLLVTTGGRDTNGNFKALVSLDFAPAYNINVGAKPEWDGVWIGPHNIKKIFTARRNGIPTTHMLVYANDRYEVWHLGEGLGNDTAEYSDTTTDISSPIRSRLYTRAIMYNQDGSGGAMNDKRFSSVQLWVRGITGTVTATAYFKRLGYECWSRCRSVTMKAGTTSQSRYRLKLTYEGMSESGTGNTLTPDVGMFFEHCIEFTGPFVIYAMLFTATIVSADTTQQDDEVAVAAIEEDEYAVELDDYDAYE